MKSSSNGGKNNRSDNNYARNRISEKNSDSPSVRIIKKSKPKPCVPKETAASGSNSTKDSAKDTAYDQSKYERDVSSSGSVKLLTRRTEGVSGSGSPSSFSARVNSAPATGNRKRSDNKNNNSKENDGKNTTSAGRNAKFTLLRPEASSSSSSRVRRPKGSDEHHRSAPSSTANSPNISRKRQQLRGNDNANGALKYTQEPQSSEEKKYNQSGHVETASPRMKPLPSVDSLYRVILELQKELKMQLQHTVSEDADLWQFSSGPGSAKPNDTGMCLVNITKSRLKDIYVDAILRNVTQAAAYEIENLLWKNCYYRIIEAFKKRIGSVATMLRQLDGNSKSKEASSDPISGKVGITRKRNKYLQRMRLLMVGYENVLKEGYGFYDTLVRRVAGHYGLDLSGFYDYCPITGRDALGMGWDDTSESMISLELARVGNGEKYQNVLCAYKFCFRFFIAMGDLERYHYQLYSDINTRAVAHETQMHLKRSEKYYRLALRLFPENGRPLSQLAVLYLNQNFNFESVFYNVASLSSKCKFPTSLFNLNLVLDQNETVFQELKPLSAFKDALVNSLTDQTSSSLSSGVSRRHFRKQLRKQFVVRYIHILKVFVDWSGFLDTGTPKEDSGVRDADSKRQSEESGEDLDQTSLKTLGKVCEQLMNDFGWCLHFPVAVYETRKTASELDKESGSSAKRSNKDKGLNAKQRATPKQVGLKYVSLLESNELLMVFAINISVTHQMLQRTTEKGFGEKSTSEKLLERQKFCFHFVNSMWSLLLNGVSFGISSVNSVFNETKVVPLKEQGRTEKELKVEDKVKHIACCMARERVVVLLPAVKVYVDWMQILISKAKEGEEEGVHAHQRNGAYAVWKSEILCDQKRLKSKDDLQTIMFRVWQESNHPLLQHSPLCPPARSLNMPDLAFDFTRFSTEMYSFVASCGWLSGSSNPSEFNTNSQELTGAMGQLRIAEKQHPRLNGALPEDIFLRGFQPLEPAHALVNYEQQSIVRASDCSNVEQAIWKARLGVAQQFSEVLAGMGIGCKKYSRIRRSSSFAAIPGESSGTASDGIAVNSNDSSVLSKITGIEAPAHLEMVGSSRYSSNSALNFDSQENLATVRIDEDGVGDDASKSSARLMEPNQYLFTPQAFRENWMSRDYQGSGMLAMDDNNEKDVTLAQTKVVNEAPIGVWQSEGAGVDSLDNPLNYYMAYPSYGGGYYDDTGFSSVASASVSNSNENLYNEIYPSTDVGDDEDVAVENNPYESVISMYGGFGFGISDGSLACNTDVEELEKNAIDEEDNDYGEAEEDVGNEELSDYDDVSENVLNSKGQSNVSNLPDISNDIHYTKHILSLLDDEDPSSGSTEDDAEALKNNLTTSAVSYSASLSVAPKAPPSVPVVPPPSEARNTPSGVVVLDGSVSLRDFIAEHASRIFSAKQKRPWILLPDKRTFVHYFRFLRNIVERMPYYVVLTDCVWKMLLDCADGNGSATHNPREAVVAKHAIAYIKERLEEQKSDVYSTASSFCVASAIPPDRPTGPRAEGVAASEEEEEKSLCISFASAGYGLQKSIKGLIDGYVSKGADIVVLSDVIETGQVMRRVVGGQANGDEKTLSKENFLACVEAAAFLRQGV
eukprot:Nk52_evm19s277 gene=Nk52_evmTU19s277